MLKKSTACSLKTNGSRVVPEASRRSGSPNPLLHNRFLLYYFQEINDDHRNLILTGRSQIPPLHQPKMNRDQLNELILTIHSILCNFLHY